MNLKSRRYIQYGLFPIVLIVLALGWKITWLGFIVPIVMITALVSSFWGGRWFCGHLCPRGAFFDRLITKISPQKKIPLNFRNDYFRWILFVLLMGFMVFRLLQNSLSLSHWGFVFWQLCLMTTLIGVILALFIHPRSWCAFCPIGTLSAFLGGKKKRLKIDQQKCVHCHLCEKKCPMNLSIDQAAKFGHLKSKDCLKCGECVAICSKNALNLPNK